MGDELQELKERLSKLPDEQLIEMVTTGAADYRPEALDYAKAELKYRRIDISKLSEESEQEEENEVENEEQEEEQEEQLPVDPLFATRKRRSGQPTWTCFNCGGQLQ